MRRYECNVRMWRKLSHSVRFLHRFSLFGKQNHFDVAEQNNLQAAAINPNNKNKLEIVASFAVTVRVYYSLAVWRFKPILSAGLRFHSHLSGGLRLKNYRSVAGNHKFSSRFSVFSCFCGDYSNRVKKQHTQP